MSSPETLLQSRRVRLLVAVVTVTGVTVWLLRPSDDERSAEGRAIAGRSQASAATSTPPAASASAAASSASTPVARHCGCSMDDLRCQARCSAGLMKTRAAERAFPLNQSRDSLRAAAKQARSCEGAGSHRGKAQVTFSNSGKVSDVKLVPPVAAPTTQTCVERAFGNIQVAPFDGPPITLQKTFFLR